MKQKLILLLFGSFSFFWAVRLSSQVCEKTAQLSVTIIENKINISASATELCEGEDLRLSVPNQFQGTWQTPIGVRNLNNLQITSVTKQDAGMYIFNSIDSIGCTTSDTVDINIYERPTVVSTSNSPVCINQKIILSAAGSNGTYQWTGPNQFSSTEKNPEFTTTNLRDSGWYKVTITDQHFCTQTDSTFVSVRTCTSTEQNSTDSKISYFPNPANHELNIYFFNGPNPTMVNVYNSNSVKVIAQEIVNRNGVSVPVALLPTGVYYFQLIYANNVTRQYPFVVVHR